jgi:hypothetical protein
MKWIRGVVVACAVVALSGAAQAVTTDWGVHGPVELGSGLFPVSGSFEDRFDFTLTSGPLTLTAVSNDLEPIFDISGGLVELFTAGDLLIGSLSFDSTAVSTTFAAAPGDYYYRVTGNVTGTAGSYLVSSAVVPEPGTAALLVVGLAAVAVGVRRGRALN